MAWLFDPSAWIVGTVAGPLDFQHIASDMHTWGGNVNAGANQLTNCAAILGSVGGSSFNFASYGTRQNYGTDQNYVVSGKQSLSTGVAVQSLNDAVNTYEALQIEASFLALNFGTGGNVAIGISAAPASAARSLCIGVGTAPTANPASGHCIYVDPADNKLKSRGSSGTVTVLAVP